MDDKAAGEADAAILAPDVGPGARRAAAGVGAINWTVIGAPPAAPEPAAPEPAAPDPPASRPISDTSFLQPDPGPAPDPTVAPAARPARARRWTRLESVTVENFKAIAGTTIALGDVTILVGPNGCGKSSVLQAIHWAVRAASYIAPKNSKEMMAFDRIDYLPSSEPLKRRTGASCGRRPDRSQPGSCSTTRRRPTMRPPPPRP